MSTNNKVPHIGNGSEKQSMTTPQQVSQEQPKTVRQRENYYKYEKVKDDLRRELMQNKTAKELSESLNLSLGTVYKYKSLLSTQDNMVYRTREEKAYLGRKK